jgi:putative transposase
VIPGIPHHVTQRGNYRQQTFFQDADYRLYIRLLRDYSHQLGVTVQAYCLMPNHVHLILTPDREEALSQLLQRLHSDYARALHIHHERAGHLWQGRYFSTPMDEAHFWQAMVYVEQNPQRARLVERCWDWQWSSAATRLRGVDDGFLDLATWRGRYTSQVWKNFLELGLRDAELFERIREATGKGWPLGSTSFLERLARDLGRPVQPGPRGPKAKVARV